MTRRSNPGPYAVHNVTYCIALMQDKVRRFTKLAKEIHSFRQLGEHKLHEMELAVMKGLSIYIDGPTVNDPVMGKIDCILSCSRNKAVKAQTRKLKKLAEALNMGRHFFALPTALLNFNKQHEKLYETALNAGEYNEDELDADGDTDALRYVGIHDCLRTKAAIKRFNKDIDALTPPEDNVIHMTHKTKVRVKHDLKLAA